VNIFVLDNNPLITARYHCDKHVAKMVLETAQIMSTVVRSFGFDEEADDHGLYRVTHRNHPCVRWAAASWENWRWLYELGSHLSTEYTHRYGKTHKSSTVIENASLLLNPHDFPQIEQTPFVQAMPNDCRVPGGAVAAYRTYYLKHKTHLLEWKNRETPEWALNSMEGNDNA